MNASLRRKMCFSFTSSGNRKAIPISIFSPTWSPWAWRRARRTRPPWRCASWPSLKSVLRKLNFYSLAMILKATEWVKGGVCTHRNHWRAEEEESNRRLHRRRALRGKVCLAMKAREFMGCSSIHRRDQRMKENYAWSSVHTGIVDFEVSTVNGSTSSTLAMAPTPAPGGAEKRKHSSSWFAWAGAKMPSSERKEEGREGSEEALLASLGRVPTILGTAGAAWTYVRPSDISLRSLGSRS